MADQSCAKVPGRTDASIFVDRAEELRLLKGLLGQALAGRGQIVSVGGEGGIGKTRLVQELGNHARFQGAIFATASSYEDEGLVPYSPWIEAIRSIVSQSSTEIFNKPVGRTNRGSRSTRTGTCGSRERAWNKGMAVGARNRWTSCCIRHGTNTALSSHSRFPDPRIQREALGAFPGRCAMGRRRVSPACTLPVPENKGPTHHGCHCVP